jgi:hypothetical protein
MIHRYQRLRWKDICSVIKVSQKADKFRKCLRKSVTSPLCFFPSLNPFLFGLPRHFLPYKLPLYLRTLHTRMSNVKILNSAICKKGSMYLYEYVMYKDLQTGPCHSPTCTLPRCHPSVIVSHKIALISQASSFSLSTHSEVPSTAALSEYFMLG